MRHEVKLFKVKDKEYRRAWRKRLNQVAEQSNGKVLRSRILRR